MKNFERPSSAVVAQVEGGRETRKSVTFKKDMLAHHGLTRKSASIVELNV